MRKQNWKHVATQLLSVEEARSLLTLRAPRMKVQALQELAENLPTNLLKSPRPVLRYSTPIAFTNMLQSFVQPLTTVFAHRPVVAIEVVSGQELSATGNLLLGGEELWAILPVLIRTEGFMVGPVLTERSCAQCATERLAAAEQPWPKKNLPPWVISLAAGVTTSLVMNWFAQTGNTQQSVSWQTETTTFEHRWWPNAKECAAHGQSG